MPLATTRLDKQLGSAGIETQQRGDEDQLPGLDCESITELQDKTNLLPGNPRKFVRGMVDQLVEQVLIFPVL
jgi:hypothetical protein